MTQWYYCKTITSNVTMEIIKDYKIKICCGCNSKLKYTYEDIEKTWFGKIPFLRYPVCGQMLFEI